jgi:lipoprotein NlpI
MRLSLPLSWLLLAAISTPAFADEADDRIREAAAALKKGDADAALAAASKAVELAPKRATGYFMRGEALGRLRRSEEAIKDFSKVLTLDPHYDVALDRRGAERFKLGQIKESIEDFDAFLKLNPDAEAKHWQRGISYYYAGRFADGAAQFQLGQLAFGNDVENAFWHYLCNARQEGVEKARQNLLKVGRDRRVPMMKIYDLIQGKAKPEDVIKTAEDAKLEDAARNEALFYAHLYVALNYEAEGDAKKCLEHMEEAHKHKIGHYMWDVADVHLMLAKQKKK